MPFDLLIRGGHVFDPGQGLDFVGDVGITNGQIASLGDNLEADPEHTKVMQLSADRYVVPGLIDVHTHFMWGSQTRGVNWQAAAPDIAGVTSGATTILDAGTVGPWNFGIYPTYLEGKTKTRLICFLNIGRIGILGHPKGLPDVNHPDEIDLDDMIRAAAEHAQAIKGVKLRLVGGVIHTFGETLIDRAKEASHETRLPMMIHIGDIITKDWNAAPDLTRYLLRNLDEGDIVTHVCTAHPGGVLDANQRLVPELREARARGVVFDPASGRANFNYEVCQRLAEQDFHPHTISTDMSTPGRRAGVYGLTECMSKFLAAGYSFGDVIRMTTTNAARAVHMANEIGAIKEGGVADLTILDLVSGKWEFEDTQQNIFYGEKAVTPVQTIRAGEMIAPDWGPHPWGWLPKSAS